jgi:gamma-glutamylcyclotransferase (GGCT)/AIG2-like uncharacterized protein YtfP
MQSKFFAYGSFSKGQIHFPQFSQLITSEKKAFVKGFMYRLRCGYPVLLPDPQGHPIEGVMWDLETPESYWTIMDELLQINSSHPDRSFLKRQSLVLQFDNFSQTEAMTYCLNPKKMVGAYKMIPNGDWRKDLLISPPIHQSLLLRQKQYIYKLSRSKGREIVPIQLDLYRELMNLELIVDKGRRLALTPLGKETALFIKP